jgi:DNA-directed RNA polymerase specialized sigma24 family protein
MFTPAERRVVTYEKMIASAARRFSRAAEYDDLVQEGMIAVFKCPKYCEQHIIVASIYNRMKDWVRYVKRLRHYHSVSYEEIMHDDVELF